MLEKDEFFDEKILEYRRRARKEEYSSLQTGMYIKNELVQFDYVEIFPDKLSIMMPTTFVTLPSNLAKLKYTSEQRPQVIKTSLDTTVNLGISLLNVPVYPEQIKILQGQTKEALKRLNPAFVFYEEKVENESPLGWLEFKSYGLDGNVYNLMFFAIADGKAVHGIFNCVYEDAVEWRDAARQMIYSIKDISKEEKNEGTKNYSGTV